MIAQWLGAIALGGLAGGALAKLAPLAAPSEGHYQIPLWLCVPFVTLLLSIACGPLFFAKLWHRFDAAWAFFLGSLVAAYYLLALTHDHHGLHHLQHVANEYLAFIALVAGLYIASAGIVVHYGSTEKFQEGATFGHATHGGYRGTGPLANTVLLLLGALLANAVGTTGASVLLVRPFIRANAGRLTPMHVVFFILIVSNCGGCLTPIGDPPLYLGYIKGIPFFWELQHMWASWLIVVGGLLAVYYLYDRRVEASLRRAMQDAYKPPAPFAAIRIRARWSSIVLGGLISAGVFIDPIIHRYHANTPPIGPWIQLGLAGLSFALADKSLVRANEFSFAPAKEVATLFAGIFLTMMPALTYLAEHGKDLGIDSPIKFYFATGTLSAVLDNAPTYLNFLQVALAPQDVTPDTVRAQLATGEGIADVIAISTGAVFFGALTYIGNGPNFMVRAIAQSRGVAMPSFFAYAAWACLILVPILVLHALIVF
jgi:Na+/H+ antiporter NhaD/arsenite permease-like protein